ncbi:hypothetical protein SLS55_010503 [Diplodia seriata]|uniref:Uncharacterized protein n=1 Tax=Diplodia seriata TaxID=420778 RepID=A0ABR3BXD5_9PEZI
MPAATTSKLPKSVLAAIMKSKSKTQTDIGYKSVLLRFTASRWCKFLTKVNQYLQTGEYAPWNTGVQLEVVDAMGSKVAWCPWMSTAADIHEARTTEATHKFFLEELMLYNWACFMQFDQLKKHSLHKIHNDFPILAHEALALVDSFCPETNDFPADEGMKAFTMEAVVKNRKTLAMQPDFRKVFQKAIKYNFPAMLLEDVQHDLIEYLKDVRNIAQPMPGLPNPPGQMRGSTDRRTAITSSSTVDRLLHTNTLENYINNGALCKAVKGGFGTLLPPTLDYLVKAKRNEDFRFARNELLIIRNDFRTFNPPRNVVVENLRGQRGDMLKDLLVPLDLSLSQSPTGPVAVSEMKLAQQASPPTAPKAMQTVPSPKTKIKTEHSRGRNTERSTPSSRGRSRGRSHSPEDKKPPTPRVVTRITGQHTDAVKTALLEGTDG